VLRYDHYSYGGWWRWALVSLDGVAPSQMVGVSASVNLPLHHKVKKFSSGTGSPGWSLKKGHKTVVVVVVVTYHMYATIKCLQKSLWLNRLFSSSYILLLNSGRKFNQHSCMCYASIPAIMTSLKLSAHSHFRVDSSATISRK